MATAYLTANATDLSAANWSDATGFANAAQLVIADNDKSIQAGLAQGAFNIESLDILETCSAWIGGPGGALTCDVDGTSESDTTIVSRLRYWARGGGLYFNAGGGSTLAHYVQIKCPGARFYGTGGIFKNVHLEDGQASFADAVLATGGIWYFTGGAGTVAYHATNDLVTLNVEGGSHLIQRKVATALNIGGGQVTLDCKALANPLIVVNGTGYLRTLNSGTITLITAKSGVLDFSRLQRPLTVTTIQAGPGVQLIRSPLLTIGTLKPIGSGPK